MELTTSLEHEHHGRRKMYDIEPNHRFQHAINKTTTARIPQQVEHLEITIKSRHCPSEE